MFLAKNKDKINKKAIVMKGERSIFIFLIPTLAALVFIIHQFMQPGFSIIITLILFFLFFLITFLDYDRKTIYLTGSSIYIFLNGKQIFSSSLVDNFKIIELKQDRLGKFLNYGSLIFLNNDKTYYEFKYLDNPSELYNKTLKRYEKTMQKIDPNFKLDNELLHTKDEKESNDKDGEVDSIDKIEDNK